MAARSGGAGGLVVGVGPLGIFPQGWREGSLAPAAITISIFAVFVVVSFGTAFGLLVRNLVFAWSLRTKEYLPFPGRVRLGLRALIDVYAFVSSTWMIGVGLFVLVYLGHYTPVAVTALAARGLAGLLTFAVPYWSFRQILDDAHERMAMKLWHKVDVRDTAGDLQIADVERFAIAQQVVVADPPPVMTRRGAVGVGLAQLFAFASFFLKNEIQSGVNSLFSSNSSPKRKR